MTQTSRHLRPAVLTGVLVVLVQALVGVAVYYSLPDWQTRGQFGDVFGSVNATFSGLAFAGLIYTILLQREDLDLTRQELKRTAAAQEDSGVALREQVQTSRDTSNTQTLLSLIDYIQRPELREARRQVFALEDRSYSLWSPEERRQADIVCSTWDTVALILRNTEIPKSLAIVIGHWRHSIFRSRQLTEDHRADARARRDPELWLGFEWLAGKALDGYEVVGTTLQRRQADQSEPSDA